MCVNNQSETARSNIYEICVRGFLDPQWDWLTGLTVTQTETGETILSGPIVDQFLGARSVLPYINAEELCY